MSAWQQVMSTQDWPIWGLLGADGSMGDHPQSSGRVWGFPPWGACILGEHQTPPALAPCGVYSPCEATHSHRKVTGFQKLNPPDPDLNPNQGVWPMNLEGLRSGTLVGGILAAAGVKFRVTGCVRQRTCKQLLLSQTWTPVIPAPPTLWLQLPGGEPRPRLQDIRSLPTWQPWPPRLCLRASTSGCWGPPRVWGRVGSRVPPQCGAGADSDSLKGPPSGASCLASEGFSWAFPLLSWVTLSR